MIFDFLKKIFGWVDEGCKKRKATDDHFDEEYVTPKKFKNNYNSSPMMGDYLDIEDSDDDDDIVFLGEQKCSSVKSCVKLNGTHNKQQQPYQFHNAHVSTAYKTTSNSSSKSTHYSSCCNNKPTMNRYVDYNHQMQDSGHRCSTLSKTNQLKERHQYEELLQNFNSNRRNVSKDKRVDARKPIEVIELDSTETAKNDTRPIVCIPELISSYRRSSVPTSSRVDKETFPTSVYDRIDAATTRYSKVLDKPNTSGTIKSTSTPRLPVKVAATNSLRDELAAKAVMRQDFIPKMNKRYNERIEQSYREAEELKRMTCVLSKHNRCTREAALEEQLARSMKLCLAVLDDREEPEEPALPKLTDEMLREVKNALVHSPADEILAEGFGLRITRKDLHTLAGLNWLNDEVINFYMNLLIARGHSSDKYPKVHAMNTFFYPKLLSGGHASLRRWTRKVDIFAQDVVVVPVHLDIHWCMSIIDFRDKSIVYYDSMGGSNPKCLAALKQYLLDESMDKKKQTYNMGDWKLHSAKKIPQQLNGSDCGVFSCMFAEYVCANKKIMFTQEDMPYFRNKMVYEILKEKLL